MIVTKFPAIDHQQNEPELKDLVHYSDKIVKCWKQLALQLSLSPEVVDTIDVNNEDVNNKCYEMFSIWLRQTCDPCWCQVANAFKMVKLYEAAREIENKLGIDTMYVVIYCTYVHMYIYTV